MLTIFLTNTKFRGPANACYFTLLALVYTEFVLNIDSSFSIFVLFINTIEMEYHFLVPQKHCVLHTLKVSNIRSVKVMNSKFITLHFEAENRVPTT